MHVPCWAVVIYSQWLYIVMWHFFWGSETHAQFFFWGGGILGCLGRSTPPAGGHAGSENNTLLPMTMTCAGLNSVTVRLSGQKLSSGNSGGGRIKKIK